MRTRSKSHGNAIADGKGIVRFANIVGIKEFAKPLKEFEIILKAPLDQTLNGYLLAHRLLLEAGLKELKVMQELMLLIGTKFDTFNGNRVREQHIHKLAICSACQQKEPVICVDRLR